MEILNILAEFIAKEINISPPAARGLLKLSIKDQIGPFKPLNQINFRDLKNTINSSLKTRLINLDVSNVNLLIENLIQQLIDKQSLIPMTKI